MGEGLGHICRPLPSLPLPTLFPFPREFLFPEDLQLSTLSFWASIGDIFAPKLQEIPALPGIGSFKMTDQIASWHTVWLLHKAY